MAAAITVAGKGNDFGHAQAHRWPALPHRSFRIFAQALLLQIMIHPSRHRRPFLLQGGPDERSGEDRLCPLSSVSARWRQELLRVQVRVRLPVCYLAHLVNRKISSQPTRQRYVWVRLSE